MNVVSYELSKPIVRLQSPELKFFTGKHSHSCHLKKHAPYLLAGSMPLARGLGLVPYLVGWC